MGTTGSGKSHLTRALLMSTPGRRLILDPGDSHVLDRVPGRVNFSDPKRWPDVGPLARFVPQDPYDLDAYDELYHRAFLIGRTLVVCDELGIVMPSRGEIPKWGPIYVTAGRKRELGHIGCHTRPIDVSPKATAVVQHVIAFAVPLPDDRRRLAAITGLPTATLDQAMNELPERGFLWADLGARRTTICPPLS